MHGLAPSLPPFPRACGWSVPIFFNLLLYRCFQEDSKLLADFPTLFYGLNLSGYNVIYKLAVAAQLPMLSHVGFEAAHPPPVMDDKDTVEMYTERWKSWLTAADHIGWSYSDRWFLNEYVRGLHGSLGTLGLLMKSAAMTSCRNEYSAYQ